MENFSQYLFFFSSNASVYFRENNNNNNDSNNDNNHNKTIKQTQTKQIVASVVLPRSRMKIVSVFIAVKMLKY